MNLSRSTARELARFLRDESSHTAFVDRLSDWIVATDALEEAGLIHHAQQIRSLIALARHSEWPFDEFRPLRELAEEAAHTLETNEAPKAIWGDIRATEDGGIVFDSIYVRGYPSLNVAMLPEERRLHSGDVQRFFRTTYLGHRYSGRTHDYLPPTTWPPGPYEGSGFLVAHRGAAIETQRTRPIRLLPRNRS